MNEMLREAQSLLATGYRRSGDWSLGEICDHLAKSLKAQSRMVSPLPAPLQFGMFLVAGTFAQATRGIQFPTLVPPKAGISDEEGVRRLAREVKRYKKAAKDSSAWMPNKSPREVRKFHLRHCAHHLGFLKPKVPERTARGAAPSWQNGQRGNTE